MPKRRLYYEVGINKVGEPLFRRIRGQWANVPLVPARASLGAGGPIFIRALPDNALVAAGCSAESLDDAAELARREMAKRQG